MNRDKIPFGMVGELPVVRFTLKDRPIRSIIVDADLLSAHAKHRSITL